jgi:hypothetical protein
LKTFSDALRTLILKHALFQLAVVCQQRSITAQDVQRAHDDDEEKKHEQNDTNWLHFSDRNENVVFCEGSVVKSQARELPDNGRGM